MHLNQSQKKSGDSYLKLQLDRQTSAILPMKHAQEVVVLPVERVTPIPNMPVCVLGLLNQRSKVFWVIDLPQLLDLQAINIEAQQYNIIIVRVGNIPLGLVIQEVKGVEKIEKDLIQSPIGNVPSGLIPYLNGCVLNQKESLLVLDVEPIVNKQLEILDWRF